MAWRTASMRRVTSTQDLHRLRKALVPHLPHSALVQGTLSAGLRYGLLDRLGIRVYIPKDKPQSSLVVTEPYYPTVKMQSVSAFWDQEQDSDEEVTELVAAVPTLDWHKPIVFNFPHEEYIGKFCHMIKTGKLGSVDAAVHTSPLYFINVFQGAELPPERLPDGYTWGELQPEDAPFIIYNCSKQNKMDRDQLAELLDCVPSVAVMGAGARYSSQGLVAWSHLGVAGQGMNAYTHPDHRSSGLSSSVLFKLSKMVITDGLVPYALTISDTVASRKIAKQLQFHLVCPYRRIFYAPHGYKIFA